eukprot:scaffold10550_cov271-Chaetoceros_neogracile.AAC.62
MTSRRTVTVKEEEAMPMETETNGDGSNLPISNHIIDDPTLLSALLQNDNEPMDTDDVDENSEEYDEIIREIDVYISPELAQSMHLIQFPLQPASHTVNPLLNHLPKGKKDSYRPPPPPVPTKAIMKPQKDMLELIFDIPNQSFSSQRRVPEVLNLTERTFASQNIAMKTHMAMGIFDSTGNKIDLIPLKSVLQMRPTFRHVDALFDDKTGEEEEELRKKEAEDDMTSKPIMFKKPENEHAMMQRKSSYAFKKANEDAEEWVELDVFGPKSDERKYTMKKAYCSRDSRDKTLRFMKAGKVGGSGGYVRSLNYLPTGTADDTIEEFVAGGEAAVMSDDGSQLQQPEWMKDLTGKALSASAALVRASARDVILVLMVKYGYLQRHLLVNTFENSGEESVVITTEVINSLLEIIARKTLNGMEMKLDDDMTFEKEFQPFAKMHECYWAKKEMALKKYIILYEEQMEIHSLEVHHDPIRGEDET